MALRIGSRWRILAPLGAVIAFLFTAILGILQYQNSRNQLTLDTIRTTEQTQRAEDKAAVRSRVIQELNSVERSLKGEAQKLSAFGITASASEDPNFDARVNANWKEIKPIAERIRRLKKRQNELLQMLN